MLCWIFLEKVSGAPGRIRTPDPLIRSQILYPAELPVRRGVASKVIGWGPQEQKSKNYKLISASPLGSQISKAVPP